MNLIHLFRIIWPVFLLTTWFAYPATRLQSPEGKTQRPQIRVLDITGMPVSITKAVVANVDGQPTLNYTLRNRGEGFVPTVQWLICYYNIEGEEQCLHGGQAIANLQPGMSIDRSRPLTYEKSWLKTYGVLPDADLFVLLTHVEWERGYWKAVDEQLFRAIKAFGAGKPFEMPQVIWQVK